jgi:hypothetical protein
MRGREGKKRRKEKGKKGRSALRVRALNRKRMDKRDIKLNEG